ncbi:MAG TPA: SGNH/GDSL hydrolase family protein [Ignavibacteriales bacterium]|nr:SGNH/GDSL hydrolase family protein [Ignavibacteriales bacterium]
MKNIFTCIFLLSGLFQSSANGQTVDVSSWVNWKKYAAANDTLKAPAPGEKRVVFFGNSITESWAKIDSSFFNENHYLDRGISGQTTSQMLIRFRQDVIDLKPYLVVIMAGINDIAENAGPIALNDVFGNIVSMIQLAQVNNIKVIISSVLPANTFPWRRQLKPADEVIQLNSMLKSYCQENNITYADYYPLMVDEMKGLDKRYTLDGVHPNFEGYQIMDGLVQESIKKLLQ